MKNYCYICAGGIKPKKTVADREFHCVLSGIPAKVYLCEKCATKFGKHPVKEK